MDFFEWNDIYSVGVKQFDDEHKRLIDYINRLHQGITTGDSKTAIISVLGGLIDYTVNHFSHEEQLLRAKGYPDLVVHKDEHDDLFIRVNEYRSNLTKGYDSFSPELMFFLKDWLTEHIQRTDKAYGVFLNEKGVR